MKWVYRLILPGILIALGVWLWLYLNPSPEEAVRRQLNGLAEEASFEAGYSLIRRVAAAQKIAGYFAPEVILVIEPAGIFPEQISRTEIADNAKFFLVKSEIRSFKMKFLDPVITLGADRKSAIVEVTLHAETEGERHLLVQEMKVTMRVVEDEWVIVRMETVRTLNQAPASAWLALAPK